VLALTPNMNGVLSACVVCTEVPKIPGMTDALLAPNANGVFVDSLKLVDGPAPNLILSAALLVTGPPNTNGEASEVGTSTRLTWISFVEEAAPLPNIILPFILPKSKLVGTTGLKTSAMVFCPNLKSFGLLILLTLCGVLSRSIPESSSGRLLFSAGDLLLVV